MNTRQRIDQIHVKIVAPIVGVQLFRWAGIDKVSVGLSYTNFKYSDMHVSSSKLSECGEITVSVQVADVGDRAGDEVVQLYIQHLGSRVDRPIKQLEGFKRVSLKPGETKTVDFHLRAGDLAYWNDTKKAWSIEHDRVRVMMGSSSEEIKTGKLVTIAK